MSDELLGLPSPEPDPTDSPDAEKKDTSSGSRSHSRHIPSITECLEMLQNLVGLVALGLMTPGQANAIRGALRDILSFHNRPLSGAKSAVPLQSDLLERLHENPQLMSLLEPFLSDEQIAALMKRAADGGQQSQT